MKSVAQAIGLTTMSLYRYVDSKEELEAVMLDVAYGPPRLDYAEGSGWRERISLWAKGIAEQRLAHPWTVEVIQTAPPLTPNVLSWTERGLEALADTPLSSQERLSVMLALDGWSQNHVRQSVQMGLTGRPDPDTPQGNYLGLISRLIDVERFPQLSSAGGESLDDDEDFYAEEFERGLGLLLDGVAALIARH